MAERVTIWTVSAIVSLSSKERKVSVTVQEWTMLKELYAECEISNDVSFSVNWDPIRVSTELKWVKSTNDFDKVPGIISEVRKEASWDLGTWKDEVSSRETDWTKMRTTLGPSGKGETNGNDSH